jgi:hypothetical protein
LEVTPASGVRDPEPIIGAAAGFQGGGDRASIEEGGARQAALPDHSRKEGQMKLDIYKSTATDNRHFVVAAGSDTSEVPEPLEELPVTSIDIEEGQTKVYVSGTQAIRDINDHGYHVIDVPADFT